MKEEKQRTTRELRKYDVYFYGWDEDADVVEEWLDRKRVYATIRYKAMQLLLIRDDLERAEIVDKTGEETIILEKKTRIVERRVPYFPDED